MKLVFYSTHGDVTIQFKFFAVQLFLYLPAFIEILGAILFKIEGELGFFGVLKA